MCVGLSLTYYQRVAPDRVPSGYEGKDSSSRYASGFEKFWSFFKINISMMDSNLKLLCRYGHKNIKLQMIVSAV